MGDEDKGSTILQIPGICVNQDTTPNAHGRKNQESLRKSNKTRKKESKCIFWKQNSGENEAEKDQDITLMICKKNSREDKPQKINDIIGLQDA